MPSAARPMTYTFMAANAVKFIIVDYPVRGNFADKFPVTVKAIRIQNLGIPGFDPDRIFENPVGEGNRMMVAIARLRQPLGDKIVWNVTVVACSEGVVAGFLPAVKLLPH